MWKQNELELKVMTVRYVRLYVLNVDLKCFNTDSLLAFFSPTVPE